MSDRVGLYPGTFDPITNGHLDIVWRASKMLDRLIVGVAENAGKNPLFDQKTRVAMVEAEVATLARGNRAVIEVRPFDNLLVHFARDCGARLIVRGLRAVSDFEYEFQMAGMNTHLAPDMETVFLMASERCQFISSRFVREIGWLGGDISAFVSPRVKTMLAERFARR